MKLAIEEGKKSKREDQRTHPLVGCVVVDRNGEILETAHRGELKPGEHAEYTALEKKLVERALVDATVYTTLEPCTNRHHPKLGCAYRILERRVARVVVGMLDPNPQVCGRGIWLLRDQRVTTDFFPDALMSEIEGDNREFIRFHRPPRLGTPMTSSMEAAAIDPQSKEDTLALTNQAANEPTEDRLFGAMLHAVFEKNFDQAKLSFDELQKRVKDPVQLKKGRIIYLHLMYRYRGDDDSLAELKILADDADTGHLASGYLGSIALLGKDYDVAINKFRAAASLANDDELVVMHLIDLADTYRIIGQFEDARATVLQALEKRVPDPTRAQLLISLAKIYGDKGKLLMKASLLTRASQLLPADAPKRFDAAYALANQDGVKELSLSHYQVLLALNRSHSNALNNFGVGCYEFGLKGKAGDAYTQAFELGETLAAANLAGMYMHAGLFKQAEAALDEASKKSKVHDNVSSARTDLARLKTEEDERWNELMALAIKEQRFISGLADALLQSTSDNWRGLNWSTHDRGSTAAHEKDGKLVFEWETDDKTNRFHMTLNLEGNAASLIVKKLSAHGVILDSIKGFAFLANDSQEIRLMLLDDDKASFVSWKAQAEKLATAEFERLPSGEG